LRVLSTESSPVTLLAIPLADTGPARWLHLVIVCALLVQCAMLLSVAPFAAAATVTASLLALWSFRQTSLATGLLTLSEEGWCLIDDAGLCWRAPLYAISMVSFACAIPLRRGCRCRWVLVTRGVCGTGPWRSLRRAVTLYARPIRLKDRIRSRRQGVRVVQREVQPATLSTRQRTANHQFGHH